MSCKSGPPWRGKSSTLILDLLDRPRPSALMELPCAGMKALNFSLCVLLILVLAACTLGTQGVFINVTNSTLRLAIHSNRSDVLLSEFQIQPGGSWRTNIAIGRLLVSETDGTELFSQRLLPLK